ncbi:hypothetical protein HNP38_001752 [Chryseobacterium defluvii]|uniref:Secreted protein (Por secretion system target) n=1 Tax=Chryseobacterium defluvii TaxID=160396 RepID=A0A840KB81_9FLAO|nr:T9SS type A sorting domain-containing protein [Chryseobacterium defluvii]MBB4806456.1 hypothetical protein [Chryseobacterium defluvii]
MKTKLFLFVLLMISLGIRAQVVTIPDANFKAKLLSSSPGNTIAKNLSGNYFAIDANSDGQIQQTEADQVSALEIINIDPPSPTNPIQNYQGILSFTNIKKIKFHYWNNPSSTFNISNLGLLEDLDIYFQNSNPGNASVTNCSNLKNFSISGIVLQNFTNNPALKNVSIGFPTTAIPQNILTSIESLANLEILTLGGIPNFGMTSGTLNLSNHQHLQQVNISTVPLSFLNLSHCNLLNTVNIHMAYTSPNQNPNYFGGLDISNCQLITNLILAGDSNVGNLTADNCPNLQVIQCDSDYLGSFSANNCPVLNNIQLHSLEGSISSNPFQAANCPNLKTVTINQYGYDSFDGTPIVNLEHLYLGTPSYYPGYYTNFFGPLQNLNISNNLQIKTLGISNHILTQLNINGLPKLETVGIGVTYIPDPMFSPQPGFATQFLQSVNIQNCPLLTSAVFEGQEGLKTVNIKNCPSLQQFVHSSSINFPVIHPIWSLQSLDMENCAALNSVNVSFNQLNHLSITNCQNLETVDAIQNELTSFDFPNTTNLKTLNLTGNKFTNLNVSSIPSVISLDCAFNLLNTVTGTSSSLKNLSVLNNNLTDLDIDNFPNLDSLIIGNNKMVDVDFSGHPNIRIIYETHPDMVYYTSMGLAVTNPPTYTKTFNVNNCTNLEGLLLLSTSLEKIFIKNGVNDNLYLWNAPNLQYICCDDLEVSTVQDMLVSNMITGCNVNTYCNFTPGGNYNTITGKVRFDENNNGCDTNDEVFEHMKLKIDDGTTTGETFVKSNGNYDLHTQAGSFTITAEPENPSLFTVTPATFTTSFADNNNHISTQNICVTKNGTVNDLEVVIAPVTDARPGFDAVYKLIWRNKGNTTLSGNVTLSFDASKMSYISSVLPSTVSGSQVTFNFNNLKPYGNTASEITFNINAPTHPIHPVNIGDILIFSATVNPTSGDLNPSDNQFTYNQTVVGSFDPNDITCLEGNQIPLSMVGKYLHYIVNFENTGTAPATNIVVEMTINPDDFDVSSLQLQNTSHSSYTKVTGNKVEFIMKDINLAAAAHGNVALKLKSKNNLVSGDSVTNQANIYFDYNFPVETNEANTMITNTTLQATDAVKDGITANIYPNPTQGEVNVETGSKIRSIEVYDAQGRIIQKHMGINSEKTKVLIHNAASGVYFFKIITEKDSFMKKVIKN